MMKKKLNLLFFLTKTQLSSVSENIGFRRWLLLSFLFFSFSLPAQIIFGDSASIHITGDAVIYHEGEIYQAKPKELATVSKKPEEKAKPKIAESKKAVEKKTVKKIAVKIENPEVIHQPFSSDQSFSLASKNTAVGAVQYSGFTPLSFNNKYFSVQVIISETNTFFSKSDFLINKFSFYHWNRPPPFITNI